MYLEKTNKNLKGLVFGLLPKWARLRTQKPFVKWLHVCFSVSNRTKTVLLPHFYISISALTL